MGAFKIEILGVGGHGCDRKAKAGDKLYGRCGRFSCPDCMAYELVQRMKQAGMLREGDSAYSVNVSGPGEVPPGVEMHENASGEKFFMVPMRAEFKHWPNTSTEVVDDMLKNERKAGQF